MLAGTPPLVPAAQESAVPMVSPTEPISEETAPNPTSAYELRSHLADDHDDDRRGAAWYELDSVHRHHHRVGADHLHEKAG